MGEYRKRGKKRGRKAKGEDLQRIKWQKHKKYKKINNKICT